MLEEDPAEITVHLVQFEKYVPFRMPGAEGTLTCVCRDLALEVWPDNRGSALRVGRRLRSSRTGARSLCAVGVVSVTFSCAVCAAKVVAVASVGWLGQTPPPRPPSFLRLVLVCRVIVSMSSSSFPSCVHVTSLPTPTQHRYTQRTDHPYRDHDLD